jgi:hypothetical protein
MSGITLESYEEYFFTVNKQDFIKKLIPGTNDFYFFSLLTALNKYGAQLPRNLRTLLDEYKKSSYKYPS